MKAKKILDTWPPCAQTLHFSNRYINRRRLWRRSMELAESRWFRAYARWIIAHRVLVVVAILGVTGVSRVPDRQRSRSTRTRISGRPQKHAYVETTNLLEELFGGRNLTVIGIVPKQRRHLSAERAGEDQAHPGRRSSCVPHAVRHNILSLAARKVKQVKGGADGMEVAADDGDGAADARGDRATQGGGRVDADLHQRAGLARRQGRGHHRRLQAGRALAQLHRAQRAAARDRRPRARRRRGHPSRRHHRSSARPPTASS